MLLDARPVGKRQFISFNYAKHMKMKGLSAELFSCVGIELFNHFLNVIPFQILLQMLEFYQYFTSNVYHVMNIMLTGL